MNARFRLEPGERKLRLAQTLERLAFAVDYLMASSKVSFCAETDYHLGEIADEIEIARTLHRNGTIKAAIERARHRAGGGQ